MDIRDFWANPGEKVEHPEFGEGRIGDPTRAWFEDRDGKPGHRAVINFNERGDQSVRVEDLNLLKNN